MEFEECIKDTFDASLKEYMKSKDCIAEKQRMAERINIFYTTSIVTAPIICAILTYRKRKAEQENSIEIGRKKT